MDASTQVLVIDAAPDMAGALVERLFRRGFTPTRRPVPDLTQDAQPLNASSAIVLIDAARRVEQAAELEVLLRRLADEHVATLIWAAGDDPPGEPGPMLEWLPADVGLDEIVGKIGTLARYAPLIRGFERELQQMQRLAEQLNQYFAEIDQEMRLAGRLQRDFLPRQLPDLPPYALRVVYRPASWISGDMYDVFRIDEHHLGLFVADAMGHGLAAGLLTMFLRQALIAKRLEANAYSIVSPAEVLASLHDCLVRQELPNCHFITAVYGILDTRRGELHLARAGHSYPLHIHADGTIREVRTDGSLLGLPDIAGEFEETRVQLSPGDKIMFYTDGVEHALLRPRDEVGNRTVFTTPFQEWAKLPIAELAVAIEDHLNREEGSLHPEDDVTVLMLEVAERV